MADFNGDRWPDMAVTGDTPDRISILLNTGLGTFGAASDIALAGGSSPHSIVAVDIDNDSDLDLVVPSRLTAMTRTTGPAGATRTPGRLGPGMVSRNDIRPMALGTYRQVR